MRAKARAVGMMMAAGMALSSLVACSSKTAEQAKSTSSLAESSLDNYVSASFDDLYNGAHHTYGVMYEGIPSSYEYEHMGGYAPTLAIFFEDERGTRKIVAYCEGGCSNGSIYYPTNIVYNQIKEAYDEKLPIRVYGAQDGPTIKINSVAYLIGPGRWQDVKIDSVYAPALPTPTSTFTPVPSGGQ